MDASPTGIKIAPPPWSCKCTYAFAFFQPASSGLPRDVAYSPLEASSAAFSAESEAGTYRGGLCMAQIIRYSETPVGAYDEFALLPGYFDSPGGGKHTRITAIYVSQADTCYNGRFPPGPQVCYEWLSHSKHQVARIGTSQSIPSSPLCPGKVSNVHNQQTSCTLHLSTPLALPSTPPQNHNLPQYRQPLHIHNPSIPLSSLFYFPLL